jgi:hypothetical protein
MLRDTLFAQSSNYSKPQKKERNFWLQDKSNTLKMGKLAQKMYQNIGGTASMAQSNKSY